MNQEYSLINACLNEVRHSELQVVGKLRLEIKLIQIKRLLLDDELLDACRPFGLTERLEVLHAQIRAICACHDSPETVSSCTLRAREVLRLLEARRGEMAEVGSAQ